jgi:tRNA (cmo5U34)-methyltransferase
MSIMTKSTVEEIRARFDDDVDRFSNLETGQSATMDAPLVLELITDGAAESTPHARTLLDVGCGAGNFSIKTLSKLPHLSVTLMDLSGKMLERAVERVRACTTGTVTAMQADIREAMLDAGSYDIILAAAVLHHLRDESEWRDVFAKFYKCLRPGGSLWIADLVSHSTEAVQRLMWLRYGKYLTDLKGEAYRDLVFSYIEREDSPRPLVYQIDLLREAGFSQLEILHKNTCFAAFGAIKA